MDGVFLQVWVEGEVFHRERNGETADGHVRCRCLVVVSRSLVLTVVILVDELPLTGLVVVLERQVQVPVLVAAL